MLLVILGFALEGMIERRVREKLSYTLRANEVSLENIDVSLIRGTVRVQGLKAKRTGIGTATLAMNSLEVDLAPMGLALVDQTPRRLEVSGAHLDLSAAGVATLRASEEFREVTAREFVMRDSRITVAITSLFPRLGQAELRVEEARASRVELHNAMSWLYKTEVLDASLHLPGPMEFGVGYRDGSLSVSGSLMGSAPITIPFAWPNPDPRKLELSQILSLVKHLIRELGPELAKRKAEDAWDRVLEAL